MARKASLTITMGPAIATGCYLELTINGTQVRFIANEGTFGSGVNRIFIQNQNPTIVEGESPDMVANIKALVNVIRNYLQEIGETRYLVDGSLTYSNLNFPNGGIVGIAADEYSDSLNFNYSVYNVPNMAGMIVTTTTNDNPATASVETQSVVCFGGTTGSANVTVTGGYPPYNFAWSDGETTQNRPLLAAGDYKVTITDSTDLSVSGNHVSKIELEFSIGQPSQVNIQSEVQGQNITVTVSGGTPGYTYAWSDGVATQNREGLAPGSYQLTVTDANGCSSTVSVVIRDFRFYFSRNPVPLELQAEDPELKPNLSFLVELWVEREYLSCDFEKVVPEPLEHPADSSGATSFDFREFLDCYLSPYLPEFGTKAIARADSVFRRFYIKHTQKYGSPAVLAPYSQIDSEYVLLGGLDTPESQANTFFTSYLQNRKPFFTWDLPEKDVYTDQPEFLFFMPNSFTLEGFSVQVKVSFSDGTSATHEAFTQGGVKRFELFCVPVGHDQLGLGELKIGVGVSNYDVYVVDPEGTVISEVRRFNLLPDYGEKRRYLIYANSMGGLNTLVAHGKAKQKFDPDSLTLERSILPGTPSTQHELEVRSKLGKVSLELTTGYRPMREIQTLQDFLLAEKVWLVENDRYTPVHVPDKNQVVLDEEEEIGSLDFEVQLPRRQRYTPQLKLSGYLPPELPLELNPMEP